MCLLKIFFDSLFGIGGGGGLFIDGCCYVSFSCNKLCIENDGGKFFNVGG